MKPIRMYNIVSNILFRILYSNFPLSSMCKRIMSFIISSSSSRSRRSGIIDSSNISRSSSRSSCSNRSSSRSIISRSQY